MGYTKLMDMHSHTDNSPDGQDAIMYMCEIALDKGLRAISFTDHCEVDTISTNKYAVKAVDQAFYEAVKARNVYTGRIIVGAGVELGQPTFDIDNANMVVNRHNYDIILASMHNKRDGEDYYYVDYSKVDVDELMENYFKDVLETARWDGYDSLAHLTYPIRYIKGKYDIDVDIYKYIDIIDEILKAVASQEKALEINTSGLRQAIKQTLPPKDIVKRFKDFGGKYITIGSDTHNVDNIGYGVDKAMKMCSECGFDFVTLYQNRNPVLIPIE